MPLRGKAQAVEWSGYMQLLGEDAGSSRSVRIHAMEGSVKVATEGLGYMS